MLEIMMYITCICLVARTDRVALGMMCMNVASMSMFIQHPSRLCLRAPPPQNWSTASRSHFGEKIVRWSRFWPGMAIQFR